VILPAGASLKPVSSPWTCSGSGPAVHCEHPFIDIAVGKSETLNVTVAVPDASVRPGNCQITNTVNVALSSDPLSGKNYQASAAAAINDARCPATPQPCPGI
jgi:hypothetical protein